MLPITFTDLPAAIQPNMFRRSLDQGEILFQQGNTAKFIYLVISGQIRLVSCENHQMVTHYFVDAYELLGESALYVPTYRCTAIAETTSEVVAIPINDFTVALKTNAIFSELYSSHLICRFYNVNRNVSLFAFPS